MRVRGRIAGIAGAAALTVLMTGCGGSGSTTDTDDATTGGSASAEEADGGTEAEEIALVAGGPLKTVWSDDEDTEHGVLVEPESLTRGDIADLENIRLRDGQEEMVPYYLTFRLTADGGDLTAPAVEDGLSLVGRDGRGAEALNIMSFGGGSPFPAACDRQAPERIVDGAAVSVCQMYLLPDGVEPLSVAWTDPAGEHGEWQVEGAEYLDVIRPLGTEVEAAWQTAGGDHDVPLTAAPVEVVRGEPSDLSDWDVDRDKTPYYVFAEYTNDGEHDILPDMKAGVSVFTAAGREVSKLNLIDVYGVGVAPCPSAEPNEMLRPGGSVTECSVYLLDEGEFPATVALSGRGSKAALHMWQSGLADR
ncbi:hypothetical protein [Streptomyces spiramenti]|uniref:Lipoprotein n=1 Tax=Streptomyces spiramenti TaxID=2720606 RepID=A0ABX1AQ94_9ACTN|nr:hypothetical protein [Streptomyces spiramenti]NJP67215.1 hypothetical protein [Streptomyces spiramenti]